VLLTTFFNSNTASSSAWNLFGTYGFYFEQQRFAQEPPLPLQQSLSAQAAMKAIAGQLPTVCGGGLFGFVGLPVKGGGLEGFAGALGECDSNAGCSVHGLVEGGPEQGVTSGQQPVSGGLAFSTHQAQPLLFVPVFGAGGLVLFDSGVGGYVGTPYAGAGTYVNVTTNADCQSKTGGG
jgi:hypothetical protein